MPNDLACRRGYWTQLLSDRFFAQDVININFRHTLWGVVNNVIKIQANKCEFKFNTGILIGFTALIMLFRCVFQTFCRIFIILKQKLFIYKTWWSCVKLSPLQTFKMLNKNITFWLSYCDIARGLFFGHPVNNIIVRVIIIFKCIQLYCQSETCISKQDIASTTTHCRTVSYWQEHCLTLTSKSYRIRQ